MQTNREYNYKIVEHIATLSVSGTVSKELNKVSYNGHPAKYDIRDWKRDENGEQPLKGLTFTEEEWELLTTVINDRKAGV